MHLGRILFSVGLTSVAAQRHHPRALQAACSECNTNSPGTQCQGNAGGICYNTNAQTGQCPAGTTLCTNVVESAATCRDLGRGDIDEGCNATYPVCVSVNGGEVIRGNLGHHCAYCINSQQPNDVNQVGLDDGCDTTARVCVGDTRQLAANVEGSTCAVCYNSIAAETDPNDIDDGCPPAAPLCVNDAGESPALWTPGTACVANCFDTSRDDADEGCPTDYPICSLEDGSNPGSGNPGVRCSNTVEVTCEANKQDWTCSVPVPLCSDYPPLGGFHCICDVDVAGDSLCWRDAFCEDLTECTSNADCSNSNEKCVSTCCGEGHCLEDCRLTGNNARLRHHRHRHMEEHLYEEELTATGG